MKSIRSFLHTVRQAYFKWRLEREIFHRIFPHLEHEGYFDYPFASDEEFAEHMSQLVRDAERQLVLIKTSVQRMPKAYGQAFLYIAYRDINERLLMYVNLAKRRVPRKHHAAVFAT